MDSGNQTGFISTNIENCQIAYLIGTWESLT
jgi:hypothetical protein